jgi:SsrA-binding protein
MKPSKINIINKKAKFEFEFIKKLDAGIQLVGSEVKSIRENRIDFTDSYCYFINNELFIRNLHISSTNPNYSHNPKRDRKLLLKRKELNKLQKDLIKGMSIVPCRIYENDRSLFKLEISLSRGKKNYDKREVIKNRDIERDINREIKI